MGIYRLLFLIIACCCNVADCTQLEICFFDSGQGNLIALRSHNEDVTKDKLLFVDCGETCFGKGICLRKNELEESSNLKRQKLQRLLQNVSECDVIVTHNHKDHKNLVASLDDICSSLSQQVRVNQYKLPREYDGEEQVAQLVLQLSQVLGDEAEVIPIRPNIWRDKEAIDDEHGYNMILVNKTC